MHIEQRVLNHNPVSLTPLDELTGLLLERGKRKAMIYLDAKFKDGRDYHHAWVIYTDFFSSDPFFIDPFTGETFTRSELTDAKARLLQPREILQIDYLGEE